MSKQIDKHVPYRDGTLEIGSTLGGKTRVKFDSKDIQVKMSNEKLAVQKERSGL